MYYHLEIEPLFGYFFVFARIGAMLMLMPGIGEMYVPTRVRLVVAFVLTLIIATAISIPPLTIDILSPESLIVLLNEIFVGLFIGALARIFLNALQVTANVMGMHISLSSATMFNPAMGAQDSVLSGLLVMAGIAMIFVSDTHYLIIEALVRSYSSFPLMEFVLVQDLKVRVVQTVSESFSLGVQLAFPVIIVATVLNAASGLLNRLMPQMQVYFMVMPLQILSGFLLISFTLSYILGSFISIFSDFMLNII